MSLEGGDSTAAVQGEEPSGHSAYERVRTRSAYVGVDVEYYLRGDQLEHDFLVQPGADPGVIRMRFDGVDSVDLSETGDLLLVSGEHTLVQQAPFAYQGDRDAPQRVEAVYQLSDDGAVGFKVGAYDRGRTLIIDPIAWTTYAGGDGVEFPIAVEAGLFGESTTLMLSTSADFPVTEAGILIRKGMTSTKHLIARTERATSDRKLPRKKKKPGGKVAKASKKDSNGFLDPLAMSTQKAGKTKGMPACSPSASRGVGQSLPGGDVRDLVFLGGAGNPTEEEGAVGRADGYLEMLDWNRGSPIRLSFWTIGSDRNDGVLAVKPVCSGGRPWVFVVGWAAGPLNFPFPPSQPYSDSFDVYVAVFALEDVPGGSLTVVPVAYTYVGATPASETPQAVDCILNRNGTLDLSIVMDRDNSDFFLANVGYNIPSRRFDQEPPEPLAVNFRPRKLRIANGATYVGGRTGDGSIGVGVFPTGAPGAAPATTVIGSPGANLVDIQAGPAAAGEATFIWTAMADGYEPPTQDTSSPFPPFGPGIGDRIALSTTIRDEDVFQEEPFSFRKAWLGGGSKRQSQLSVVSERVLGAGTTALDVRPGGAYVMAGSTSQEVFGPVDGVEPPAPLTELGVVGPNDAFVLGGAIEADWVLTVTGPANFEVEPVARNGIGTGFTQRLAPAGQTAFAPSVPLPNDMLGAVAMLIDSAGDEWPLGQFFVGSSQMNFHVPPEASPGIARLEVRTAAGELKIGETEIVEIQPSAFTFGGGVGAALSIRIAGDGTRTDTNTIAEPEPALAAGDTFVVSQFVTGTSAGSQFSAFCEGREMAVLGAGPAAGLLGVEQVAVQIDHDALGGSGPQNISCHVAVDGLPSNAFGVRFNRMP